MSEALFSERYHDARKTFFEAVEGFESAVGRTARRHRFVVDEAEDLTIDAVEFEADTPQKLYVGIGGLHGLEGYMGSAVMRGMLAGPFRGIDFSKCGMLLVHGMNPWGFHNFRRVNANNVDLNRNFEIDGEPLYGSDSSGYQSLEHLLNPVAKVGGGAVERGVFFTNTLTALLMRGMGPLRQATLSGQYATPKGLFYGGAEAQQESVFYQGLLKRLAKDYGEILLTDLHTGYGARGQAYPLFPQADSPEFKEYAAQGVKDGGGSDKTYTARGELVRYSYQTAKAANPGLVFNGLVVEVGTHGLGVVQQLKDLEIVVRENQAHHHGGSSDAVTAAARSAFREFFYPTDPEWRRQSFEVVSERIESFLASRGFLSN